MSTSREQEAEEYLNNHRIIELMKNLTSMLLFYRPDRPKEFLISQLEKLKTSRLHGVESPCLIDESNLDAVFGILDPANRGYISCAQYREAMMTLGIKDFSEYTEDLETDRISRETFKREAKEGLLRGAATFQM
ncbi:EF-hand calcium-binding domain-containing protein 10-like [Astyanax mexicanus]|uniref:EF-hand calcium binding domain 10 n=1 Tax=Astyanax mexicanus TaxID=7994 RepID=A0A8B9M307_ASTMX|nr:EF-hand calcium-binding domain-containing protein 10-like [Astyanax mexicanus]